MNAVDFSLHNDPIEIAQTLASEFAKTAAARDKQGGNPKLSAINSVPVDY